MNEENKLDLCMAVKQIAWGYVLLHFNINLGTFNILPNWLGYLLMVEALSALSQEEPSAALLRPLGQLLAGWEGLCWVMAVFKQEFSFPLLNAAAAAATLYFHFQLLTDLAIAARNHQCPQEKRILRLRTARTLLVTLLALPFPWERYQVLTMVVALVYMAAAVWICSVLFSLNGSLREEQAGGPASDAP